MKNIYLLIVMLFSVVSLNAQVIYAEDFESGEIPADWVSQSNATDGGWRILSNTALSSTYFQIPGNGSNFIAGTNDDQCNCDKSNEYFITEAIDLSQVSSAILYFDAFYGDGSFQGTQEDATIEVSTDGGLNWQVLSDLEGEAGWSRRSVDLSSVTGNESVFIGFRYHDSGGWMFGFALDNIVIEVPPQLEASVLSLDEKLFGELGDAITISGTVRNNGSDVINQLEMSYSVNGENPVTQTFSNNIFSFTNYDFEFDMPWQTTEEGSYTIDVQIVSVNGGNDDNLNDNASSYTTRIYGPIEVPNKIEDYLAGPPEIMNMPSATPFLDKPTDLDFFPLLGKDELWIVNQRTESDGGSTLKISDASLSTPSDYLMQVDGNAWHFMSLPTGIAFSPDNYNFATSPGVRDANHNGGTFTGPTLWSSDPLIYAQPSGGNGSHLDMLHGSPFSMGIAHEVDNVFWIYDNFNRDIVRYDFVEDHGPGNDDHSDGIVRRFKNTGIMADSDIPNHMIVDKETGWLYFVDNGNDRVVRIDINSGTVSIPQALINEPLAEHSAIQGFTQEVIIDSGLEQACGIEIFENSLLVGDYANGNILVYDMDNNFEFKGIIPTDLPGLTGIKVGPDGNIWYTNRLLNQLNYLVPGESVSVNEIVSSELKISPNPTSGEFTLNLGKNAHTSASFVMTIMDSQGKEIMRQKFSGEENTYNVSAFDAGIYIVLLQSDTEYVSQKLVISK